MTRDLVPSDDLIAALSGESPLKALKCLAQYNAENAVPAEKKLPYHVMPLLQHCQAEVRLEAILLLGDLRQWHKAVEAVFITLSHKDLYDPDHEIREQLKVLLRSEPEIANLLIAALRSPIGYVRYQAVCALGLLGLIRWEQLPALEDLSHDENPRVREAARRSLGQLQRPAEPKAPAAPESNAENEAHGDRMGFLEID